jgi:hypothetical protein
VENEHAEQPANYELGSSPVVMFQLGPAFAALPGARGAVLARYAKETCPLESGLLLHPETIEGQAAAMELTYGSGRIVLFGFKPQFRGESHATYKYLFNELYVFDRPALPELAGAAAKAENKPAKRAAGKPAADDGEDEMLPQ